MIYWDGMVRIATSIENPSLSRFRILLMSWYAVRRFAGDGFFLWKIMDRKVFIKSCYDVKNYESRRRDPTFCFIWRKSKFNPWSFFVSLSLSLSASLSYGKIWGERSRPGCIKKEHAKFKSLMCLCMKTHQKVEGLGKKVIHRLGLAGCCGCVVLFNHRVHWIIFSSFNFACYGPRKTSTTVDHLSRAFCFIWIKYTHQLKKNRRWSTAKTAAVFW